ncbi:MAG: hypothetical protein JRG73_06430 [Deltaproteobacteria bacterium]|nr:hypothetical protein [Deltaproteobacteria bacterium]
MDRKNIVIIASIMMAVIFSVCSATAEEPVATTFSYGAQWGLTGKPALVKRLEANYRVMGNQVSSIFFEDYGMSRDWNTTSMTPVDVTNVFTSGARKIYCWNSVSQVAPGTTVTFNWFSPRGTLVESTSETLPWSGYGWVTSVLDLESASRILGDHPGQLGDIEGEERTVSALSGIWHVDVEVDNEVIHQQTFAIDSILPILERPRISRGGFTVRDSGVVTIGSSTMSADLVSSIFSRAQVRVEDANGATIWIPIGNLAQSGERITENNEREVSHEINIPVGIVPQGRFSADLIKIISRDRSQGGNISVWPNFEVQ